MIGHIIFFAGGLSLVIYGVCTNTKGRKQIRNEMLKKYILIYFASAVVCNFVLIPILSFLKK